MFLACTEKNLEKFTYLLYCNLTICILTADYLEEVASNHPIKNSKR